ncbi:hypothetical protein [Thermogemmata fonticola]|uniref:Uncharacterized protein n=1 Tax=Thermogemmata fonticola TaxID=2755323 RepID=A0A7V8VBM6_9BACT|nr:hypothetical protein [Thermogemmata fonticola]MBA2225049.1 hypothetical protein [Thermogemmata fonticola]
MSARLSLAALGGALILLAPVSAQYPTPALIPPNPLYQHPAYRYQFYLGTTVPTVYGRTFVGVTVPYTRAPQLFSPNMGRPVPYSWWSVAPGVPTPSGYMSGSASSAAALATQRAFQAAQAEALRVRDDPEAAQRIIAAQASYEKAAPSPRPGLPPPPPAQALIQALTPEDDQLITSGQALNTLLQALPTIDTRAAEPANAFLPPQLLQEIRFATPKGELLNLARLSGRLPFPEVFEQEPLRPLKETLERDFAAVALPLLAGKSPDRAAIAQLENTLLRLEQAAAPFIRNLSFDEAAAARRFLNQFHNALRTLKSENLSRLWNPNWNTLGANVADLTQHMLKHQLRFDAAPTGSEPAYLALHRALAAYFLAGQKTRK